MLLIFMVLSMFTLLYFSRADMACETLQYFTGNIFVLYEIAMV